MRILVISDIHANRAALEAIREPFDICLNLGDIVEYGPEPTACIEWVQQHAHYSVRGNHDHNAAHHVEMHATSGFRFLSLCTRQPTRKLLAEPQRRFLAELPMTQMIALDGLKILMVHASPRDPLDEYVPNDIAAWESRIAGLGADFVCVGHTHQQFCHNIRGVKVLNPGSVGLSRDGNPNSRYAIIDKGEVQLKEVAYPIEQTIAAVSAWDIHPLAKEKLIEVYQNGKLGPW